MSTGPLAEKERWFATFDAAAEIEKTRNFLTFLVDLTLKLQRQAVWKQRQIRFQDTLGEVFQKESQTMQVVAHILRDPALFQV